jgi:cytochrome P450
MTTTVRRPPGPRGLPLLGSLGAMITEPIEFFRTMALDYGPISYTRLGPNRVYMLNDPALIEEFLVAQQRSAIKDPITHSLEPLIGQGLLTSEGELWKRQRKLAAQPLSPKRLVSYEGAMVAAAESAFASYRHGETRDFHGAMMTLTLEVVSQTLLGVSTGDQSERISHALEASLDYFEERIYSWGRLLPVSFPTPKLRRFRRAKRELDQIVRGIIERCRHEDRDADYLLARLVRARTDDQQGGMSEQQLLDEAVTMLLAGHETTALALMFAVYLLSHNPAAATRLQAEVDRELGERTATAADLERLPYLDAVVREKLRLYPPAYVFARQLVTQIELGGFTLPVDSHVLVSPYGVHRNPTLYKDPERFDPERWLSDEARKLPRFAYLPFGGGHRICIGSHFAQLEAGLLLATMVQRLELSVTPGFKLELAPVLTLRSRHGMPVRVSKRPRHSASSLPVPPAAGSVDPTSAPGCPFASA